MTAKPTLYLHFGTHKTGTTTQQRSLARHRVELSKAGLHYPDITPTTGHRSSGHHFIAHALAVDEPLTHELRAFRRHINECSADHEATLISAEAFYRRFLGNPKYTLRSYSDYGWAAARLSYVEKVADYFDDFNVVPVIYFRDISAFAESLFKENQFKEQSLYEGKNRDFLYYVEKRNNMFEFDQKIYELKRVFGKIITDTFERSVKEGLTYSIIRKCNMNFSGNIVDWHENRSPNNRAALWALKKLRGKNNNMDNYIRTENFLASRIGTYAFRGEKISLWPDHGSWIKFRKTYESEEFPELTDCSKVPKLFANCSVAEKIRIESAYTAWKILSPISRFKKSIQKSERE